MSTLLTLSLSCRYDERVDTGTAVDSYEQVIEVPYRSGMSAANNAARAPLVNGILSALIPHDADRLSWLPSHRVFVNRIVSHRQLTYLQRVLDLSRLVASNPDSRTADADRASIVMMVNGGNHEGLKSIHANREFIDRPMNDFGFFIRMLKRANYSIGEHIPTLRSHLKMGDKHRVVNENGDLYKPLLYGESTLCEVVEAYPDRTDEIIELIERGVVDHHMAAALDSFDFGTSKPLLKGAL
jgi:hypothetical protein